MICSVCGKSNDDAARFCRFCGSTLLASRSGTEVVADPGPATTRYAVGKSPLVALFFAMIPVPGLGQFYNGDFKRGILIMILAAVAFCLIPETACSSTLPLVAVWLWGWINAYNVAARKTPLWT